MAWVHFIKDFNYMKPSFTIAYKAGMTLNVKRECADEALAKGCAKAVRAPRKGEETTNGDEGED
ncbi:hypothetical protein [Brucella sp. BO2]|uniref:hypothetical protein n=1 Tax=Brucella sp. BO2 TaxID=693750 RepID=UPI0002DC7E7C|nr:hypothetical protein [Brucella sp. BO2]